MMDSSPQPISVKDFSIPPIYVISGAGPQRWERLKRNTAWQLRPHLKRWLATQAPADSESHADGTSLHGEWLTDRGAQIFPNWSLRSSDPKMYVVPGSMEIWRQGPVPYNIKYWSRPVSGGEAALALASFELWRALAERKHSNSWAVVLEDDAIPKAREGFLACLATIGRTLGQDSYADPWLVYLMTGTFASDDLSRPPALGSRGLLKPLAFSMGSVAYALSASFAALLVTRPLVRCLMPVDEFLTAVYSPNRHPRADEFKRVCWPTVGHQPMQVWRWVGASRPYRSDAVMHKPDLLDFGLRWYARILGQRARLGRRFELSNWQRSGSTLERKGRHYPVENIWLPSTGISSGCFVRFPVLVLRAEMGSLTQALSDAGSFDGGLGAFCRRFLRDASLGAADPGAACGYLAPSAAIVRWRRVRSLATLVTVSSRHACPTWNLQKGMFQSFALAVGAIPRAALMIMIFQPSRRSLSNGWPWGLRLKHLWTVLETPRDTQALITAKLVNQQSVHTLATYASPTDAYVISLNQNGHTVRELAKFSLVSLRVPLQLEASEPQVLNVLRVYGPVVRGGLVSAVLEVSFGYHRVAHVRFRTESMHGSPREGNSHISSGPLQIWDDPVMSGVVDINKSGGFSLYFGGDCCASLPGSRMLLGIVAIDVRPPDASLSSSGSGRLYLHRLYALQDSFPFDLIALSPPFCFDHAGQLTWPGAGTQHPASAMVATCERRQLVRGVFYHDASGESSGRQVESNGSLSFTIGVNDCEASIARIKLGAILPLLSPVRRNQDSGTPKIIHQVWISANDERPPPHMTKWLSSWQALHPHWSVRLWTSSTARALVHEHYPFLLQIYDAFDVLVKRADLVRYVLLHKFGGVAVDVDLEALRPIDDLVFPLESVGDRSLNIVEPVQIAQHDLEAHTFSIGFMASIPSHPFWWHLLQEVQRLAIEEPSMYVLGATGNRLLTRVARHRSFKMEVLGIDRAKIFPFPYTHKLTRVALMCGQSAALCAKRFPAAYTVHHAAHSWASEDRYREPDALYRDIAARIDS